MFVAAHYFVTVVFWKETPFGPKTVCVSVLMCLPVFYVSSTAMYAVYQLSTRQREDVSTGLFGTPVLCCIHRVTVT